MGVREEVIRMVEEMSESDLLTVKRILRGLRLPEESEPVPPAMSAEERRAKARANLGALSHLPGSMDEFLREKHEEIEREEQRYRQRHPEEA